jgi:hypothetical protein
LFAVLQISVVRVVRVVAWFAGMYLVVRDRQQLFTNGDRVPPNWRKSSRVSPQSVYSDIVVRRCPATSRVFMEMGCFNSC